MMIKLDVEIIPVHFIWIMGLLEAITVPLVVAIPLWTQTAFKNPLHGIVVGFVGIVILFYGLNLLLRKLNIALMEVPVTSISVFASAFWSGVILALIFLIQLNLKSLIPFGYPFKEAILGFFSAGGAIFLAALIYQACIVRFPFLAIAIRTSDSMFLVKKISLWRFSLWSGVYESIALPIILLWSFYPRWAVTAAVITGLMGGFAGGGLIWLISLKHRRMGFIVLEKTAVTAPSEPER